jgi:hypothetical protein
MRPPRGEVEKPPIIKKATRKLSPEQIKLIQAELQETNPGKHSYEPLPSSIWATAWAELYKVFSEQMRQDEVDLMDSVFNAVVADYQDEIARQEEHHEN